MGAPQKVRHIEWFSIEWRNKFRDYSGLALLRIMIG